MAVDHSRYQVTTYDEFRRRARDPKYSTEEKIGFPDVYRKGFQRVIADDIFQKLELVGTGLRVLDIGCGCGSLAQEVISRCSAAGHRLVMTDSPEMLEALGARDPVVTIPGRFPDNLSQIAGGGRRFDRVLVYSVIQYVHREGMLENFVGSAASLLENGGRLLVGDIPNASMRRRFLASPAGLDYHRANYDPSGRPNIPADDESSGEIVDSTVLSLVASLRRGGYHSFLLPQDSRLPQANRREDLLVVKP